MDIQGALIVSSFILLVAAVVYARGRASTSPSGDLASVAEQVRLLSERLSADAAAVGLRLEGIDHRIGRAQASTSTLASDIFETLGDVRRATDTVAQQAREFTSLQDLLKAPKARGGLGEAMLEELLGQVLPPHAFSTQHRFSSGEIVDAVVKAGGRIVPIDSKFPLANFQRMSQAETVAERTAAERQFAHDVDKHIHDISSRYIVPDEDTFDFAVMYVPAEGVYAEVLRLQHRKQPLFETAIASRVVPMSPLTMYGYLQTILFGLKCLRVEERAEAILGFCGRLQRDVGRFVEDYETLGRHLGNARNKYEDGRRQLDRFQDKLDRVADFDDDPEGTPALEVVND